jgi:hypothetical protein
MSAMKVVGVVVGGVAVAGLVGAGIVWWRRRQQKSDGATPSTPDRAKPTPSDPSRKDTAPRGHMVELAQLDPELRGQLPDAWPPDDATIDALTRTT